MSGKRTPPEAQSDPRGHPALSTPPKALEDAGTPHPASAPGSNDSASKPSSSSPSSSSSSSSGLKMPSLRPKPNGSANGAGTSSYSSIAANFYPRHAGGPPPTGPLARKVSAAEAETYFKNTPPMLGMTKWSKWIGMFGWATIFGVATYGVLFSYEGGREHVFSPIRRQVFGIWHRLNGTYDPVAAQAELDKRDEDLAWYEQKRVEQLEDRKKKGVYFG
ncbi:hypothetical protein BD324DRAFT_624944 [Kockovaella imperatae]|uniref:Uncharacterized protein n=1 Tax=Kockovaella imperatae TaxID=4999 RepID=A0A1Y1UI32_9TREE|nr:hypothetical protein BD324DRAFT_624944 [Kockovaella imperatae]ORX37146.1 hypothetical protein BD324DRAFT_624944 [Kockovaella imperatae]